MPFLLLLYVETLLLYDVKMKPHAKPTTYISRQNMTTLRAKAKIQVAVTGQKGHLTNKSSDNKCQVSVKVFLRSSSKYDGVL